MVTMAIARHEDTPFIARARELLARGVPAHDERLQHKLCDAAGFGKAAEVRFLLELSLIHI